MDLLFQTYSKYHQTKGNKLTHYVGIPLIVLSTFGLLSQVNLGNYFDLGLILWILTSFYYLKNDSIKYSLPFSVLTFLIYLVSMRLSWPVDLFFFGVGWALQAFGHYYYEKKSPAFLTNFFHLLIGPYWIYRSFLRGLLGYSL